MKKNNNCPKFEFESFFQGKVSAKGYMTFFHPKKVNKKLNVFFTGTFKNKKLKLIEEYLEEDKKTTREWQFEKISDYKFIGNGNNIKKAFEFDINSNFLEMRYQFKTQYKEFSFNVSVKDQMYQLNRYTLINYTKISKFFVPVAEAQLLYTKL